MKYRIDYTEAVLTELKDFKKSEPAAYKKVLKLIEELFDHPTSGTGKPKPMKHLYKGCYSRRITQKHRLVYSINDEKITVLILSVSGHYNDK